LRLPLLLLLAAGLGCAGRETRLVDRLDESAAMRAAVLQVAPVGTPVADAVARLGAQGFHCQPTARNVFAGVPDSLTYAYCDGSSRGAPLVSRRWQLALVDSGGRVSDVHATTHLVGP
jgi:hypothetical protein